MPTARPAAISLVTAVLAAGCTVPSTPGTEGHLAFNYDTDALFGAADLDDGVAVGAALTLNVLDAASGRPVTFGEARSSDPSRLQVVATGQTSVEVRALAPGEVHLEVRSGARTDRLPLVIAEVARVELERPSLWAVQTTSGLAPEDAVYLQGGASAFPVRRFDAEGGRLIDEGLAAPQLTATPAVAVTSVAGGTDHLFVRFAEAGTASISAPGGAALDLDIVPLAAVASIALDSGGEDAPVPAGGEGLKVLTALTDAGRPVAGLEGLATLEVTTPEVCAMAFAWPASFLGTVMEGLVAIEGLAEGTCEARLTLGARTETVTVEIAAGG